MFVYNVPGRGMNERANDAECERSEAYACQCRKIHTYDILMLLIDLVQH